MPEKLQVLIVEDRAADAELMVKELQKAGFELDWQRVETERQLKLRLTPRLDLILTDYNLPGFGALPVLSVLHEMRVDVPVLVVSGSLGDEKAVEVLTAGATDYILKDRMARLGPAVRRALQEKRTRLARLQAEGALRSSEEQMRGILSTIDDVVWSVSLPDSKVLYLNPAAEKFLGRPVAAFKQNPLLWMESVHPEDRVRALAAQEAALRWGTAEYEYRVARPDGSVRQALMRCWVAYGGDGQPARIEGILTDVTEKRAAEAQQKRLRHMEELNAFKSQFISMVAHDLNNVLTPMRLNLHLVAHEIATQGAQSPHLANLDAGVDRLAAFLGDLLDAARLQSGELVLRRADVDLAARLRALVDAQQAQAAAEGIRLTLDAPASLQAHGDPHRLDQVAANLLSNALKFTPRGGSVEVGLVAEGDNAVLAVRDTGRGIAKEDLPKLFQPFTKLAGAQQGRHTGTGLGLFISRGIVEQHGGSIWCESEGPGKGTVFTLRLPLQPAPVAAPPVEPTAPLKENPS
jgi:PAS domain S-box-containing protein